MGDWDDCHAITRDRVLLIRDDLKTRHIRPNYFCKAERKIISKERDRLIDCVEELTLRKRSLLSQLKSIKKDIVSMPELWLLKRETVDECSKGKEQETQDLIKAITDTLEENKQLKLEIFSLEQAIENEVSSRFSESNIDIDTSDWKLVIPQLDEFEQQHNITSQLNEWNLDRIYASQLEMNKFDLLKPKLSHRDKFAAASLSNAVAMTVRKEEASSDEKRVRVHNLMEKCARQDDKVHKMESIVRRLRQKKIAKENEWSRQVAELRATNRANLDSMREEILSLNTRRSILRKQNAQCVLEHDSLSNELIELDTQLANAKETKPPQEEESEEEEVVVESYPMECCLLKQRSDVTHDIKLLKRQLNRLKKQSERRLNAIKKDIAVLWEKEIYLRHEITWWLNEMSNPFVLTSSVAV